MDNNLSTFSFKKMFSKIPRAFLLFLILALCFEVAVSHFARLPDYALKKALLSETVIDADVLFLGDSSLTRDLDVPLFEETTGLSMYSLGTARTLGVMSYYLLWRYYLKHQRPPRYLVLMMVPESVSSRIGDHYEILFSQYFRGSRELLLAWPRGISFPFLLRYGLWDSVPSIWAREYLGDLFFRVRREAAKDRYQKIMSVREPLIENKGTILKDLPPADLECNPDPSQHFFWNPESRYYLKQLIRNAETLHIKIFYAAAPIAGSCFTPEQILEIGDLHASLIKDYPELEPLQPDFLVYPREKFSDTRVHLNKRAARLYTALLAKNMVSKT